MKYAKFVHLSRNWRESGKLFRFLPLEKLIILLVYYNKLLDIFTTVTSISQLNELKLTIRFTLVSRMDLFEQETKYVSWMDLTSVL